MYNSSKEFFELSPAFNKGALCLAPENSTLENNIDDLISRGELIPEKPVSLTWVDGEPTDLASTMLARLFIASERFVNLLRQERFTGWSTYPVEIRGQGSARVEGYHGLAVTGRCGPIDTRMALEESFPKLCDRGAPIDTWRGLHFDEATWDGTDIFMPQERWVFVTERLKLKIESAGFTNVSLKKLSEFRQFFRPYN